MPHGGRALLLEARAQQDPQLHGPLWYAAQTRELEIVRLLLAAGRSASSHPTAPP